MIKKNLQKKETDKHHLLESEKYILLYVRGEYATPWEKEFGQIYTLNKNWVRIKYNEEEKPDLPFIAPDRVPLPEKDPDQTPPRRTPTPEITPPHPSTPPNILPVEEPLPVPDIVPLEPPLHPSIPQIFM